MRKISFSSLSVYLCLYLVTQVQQKLNNGDIGKLNTFIQVVKTCRHIVDNPQINALYCLGIKNLKKFSQNCENIHQNKRKKTSKIA
jgi:hypothetical protein